MTLEWLVRYVFSALINKEVGVLGSHVQNIVSSDRYQQQEILNKNIFGVNGELKSEF